MHKESYHSTSQARNFLEMQGFKQSPHFKRGYYKYKDKRAVIIPNEHRPGVTVWYHIPDCAMEV